MAHSKHGILARLACVFWMVVAAACLGAQESSAGTSTTTLSSGLRFLRYPKPRLIILADMGNEPDEEQQMVHMLVNCNEFDLEGLIAVTGKFLNENAKDPYKRVVHPELFHKLIDSYAKVEDNLRLHADGWPTADYLHSIVRAGQPRYGLSDVGPCKASEGAKLILAALLKDDPRPLNVVINAGSNTLAQALVDLRTICSKDEVRRLVRKLRVYENGAQDNCGAWICHEFPEIHWVRSNHQCYGYMGESKDPNNPAGPWCWKPFPRTHQGQHRWAEEHIMRNHGPLGALYPYRFNGNAFLEGGGTIPWLALVNKGLYCPDRPWWGGWGGRFSRTKQEYVWSRHASVRKDEEKYGKFAVFAEQVDTWQDPDDGTVYKNVYAAVWRWRQAMLNNCIARFDWCVKPRQQANHHPVAAVGKDKSDAIIICRATPGDTLTFDASASLDPDGDLLKFHWYFYPEAGTYKAPWPKLRVADGGVRCSVAIPEDTPRGELHLILEVVDQNPIVPLTDYRRIVIEVAR